MARYQIWDKQSTVITPIGEQLTPSEWLARYPWAGMDGVHMVISGGVINGGCALVLEDMVEQYTRMGCDFSTCKSPEEQLAAIEAFEDMPVVAEYVPTAEERIAAALEYQNIVGMEDAVHV